MALALTRISQVAAFLLAFKGIEAIASEQGHALKITDVFTNSIFRNIVLSLLATLGLYILASLIFVSHELHLLVTYIHIFFKV